MGAGEERRVRGARRRGGTRARLRPGVDEHAAGGARLVVRRYRGEVGSVRERHARHEQLEARRGLRARRHRRRLPRRVRRRGDDREGGRSGGRIGNVRRRRDCRARFGRAARRLHAARGRAAHERRQHYPTHRPGRSRHGRRHDGARARQTARGVHSHGQRARTRRHQAPTRSKRGHEQPHVQAPPHRVRCRTRGVPPRARRSRRARTRLRGGARHRRRWWSTGDRPSARRIST